MECPKCGSKKINQYRMPIGKIWCSNCGFQVEEKEKNNPFLKKKKGVNLIRNKNIGLIDGI